ncbi:MAG: DUF2505 family protein [Myxococcales bacterium]|nr:DUF2505 family protein [Myxococcales bacterium]
MTIRLHDERRYPLARDALVALWKDPVFQEARSRHLGTLDVKCVVDGDVVVLEETRDTGWRPHVYVTRLTTRWDGHGATWTLERLAGPGEASAAGTIEVRSARAACTFVLEGTLEVRVPVLGRMIERLARRGLVVEKDREERFVRDWIQTISST